MNTSNENIEMQINLKEVIWDLLEQWKAVLLAALVTALLVSGAKFAKDSKAYKASDEAQKETEAQMLVPAEDRIAQIIDSLDTDEQKTVRYIIGEQEWVDRQKEYLNESILMNMDPTNQRRLSVIYDVDAENLDDLSVLLNIYSRLNRDDNLVKKVGAVLADGSDARYIHELISADSSSTQSGDAQNSAAQSSSIAVIVSVILTEDADASAVEGALTEAVNDYANDIKRDYPHDITVARSTETRFYDYDTETKHRDYFNNVYALESIIQWTQGSLSDLQKSAIEQILATKSENNSEETIEINLSGDAVQADAPRWSKKYTLLGFVLGVMAYAFAYLLLVIIKGRITYAGDLKYYTGARLLGEVYYPKEISGIKRLFESKSVDLYRYRGKSDPNEQIERMEDSIKTICEYTGIKRITLIYTCDDSNHNAIQQLVALIKSREIKLSVVEKSEIGRDSIISKIKNGIIVANDETKVLTINKLMGLCADYEVDILGTLYLN